MSRSTKYKVICQVLFCVVLLLTLNSCKHAGFAEQSQPILNNGMVKKQNSGIFGKWKLQSVRMIGDRSLTRIAAHDNHITLSIGDDNRFRGYSGCNSFSGDLKIEGNAIRFHSIYSTSKGCPGNPSIERVVFDALKNANSYELKQNQLYLRHNKEAIAIYTPDS